MLYGDIMKEKIFEYINEYQKIIKVILICIILGILTGNIIFGLLNDGLKNEFVSGFKNTLELVKNSGFQDVNMIKNGIISNAILIFIIYFCSITLLAPVLIGSIAFFKSCAIGLYFPIIFSIFGFSKGILVTLLLLILPNLIYLPSFIFLNVNAIHFHYELFENDDRARIMIVLKEIVKIGIAFSFVILSVVLEQILTNIVLNIYLNLG